MKEDNNFIYFLKRSLPSIAIIVIFALIAYGQRILSNSFSIDTEVYMYNIENTVNWDWWNSLNRWGLVWINKVFQMNAFPIFAANITTFITIILYSIGFNYIFYINMKEEWKEKFLKISFIFPIIFITNPIWAEQYNFIHQSFGVALGILLIPVSIYLFERASIIENRIEKVFIYAIGITLAVISFGVYQAIILMYIATVAFCYFFRVLKENNNSWKYLLKNIFLFVCIVIIYEIITKITGEKASYLQIAWQKDGIKICLRNIYYVIKDVVKCQTIFYNIGYLIGMLLLFVSIIYLSIKRKMKLGLLLSIIAIILAPFYIMIVTGVNQFYRTQFNYSLTVGFLLLAGVLILCNNKNIITKYINIIMIAIIMFLGYRQAYVTSNLFNTADTVYQNDVSTANKIVSRIEQQDWFDENEEYTLIFVGYYENEPSKIYLKGELIGDSFFYFGREDSAGIAGRANMFLDLIGYKFKIPTVQEYLDAKEYIKYKEIKSWPNANSITLMDNNKIIVRLPKDVKTEA